MPEANIRLAAQFYAAWNRGDVDWVVEHLTADTEMQTLRGLTEFERVYTGPEGWREFAELWRYAWSDVAISIERLEDIGEHGVLALLTFDGVRRESQVEISLAASHWLSFAEGKLSGITVMTPESADRRRHQRH